VLAATALLAQTRNELLVVNARIFTGSAQAHWAALTVEQALVAYTRGSAFAEHREHEKGTLEPGKLADFAIVSQNFFTVAPPELPKTTSVVTVVGGRVVHEAT
jgi:predicted amidohydrolase YtcJ